MTLPTSFSILAQALGWAVVHSLWQIALICLLFKALSWVLRGRNQAIYLLSLAAMVLSVIWFAATFMAEYTTRSLAAQAAQSEALSGVTSTFLIGNSSDESFGTNDISWFESAVAWLENNTALVGWAWGIGVVLLWLRLLGGWWLVQRLRRRDVVSPDNTFQQRCRDLSKKLKINKLVALLESPHVSEPLTLGFWKPVILFPTGMLLALSPAQVEALLLHELAHIRRHDYLINLLQLTLETCFFYHPLFWLISRDARVRREFCCDDVVLLHTSDRLLYAKTLTDLQLSFLHPTTQFTMNATGKSRFTERILRIAGIAPNRESRPNWLVVMLLPTLIAVCSWWPSQASPLPMATDAEQITVASDSLPPRKAAPKAAKTTAEPKAAPSVPDNTLKEAEAPKVAMEAVKMNIFYIGVDNPLRVAVSNVPSRELKINLIGNGSITGSEGNYIVQVKEPGTVTIQVSRLLNGQTTVLSEQKYRVKRIPDPTPMFGGMLRSGKITKEQLLATNNLQAMLVNFDFDAVCEIGGFELTILPKEQNPISFSVVGNMIPPSAREYLEKLGGDGDAIFFDDIKVKCPGDAALRNVGGLAFKVKPL